MIIYYFVQSFINYYKSFILNKMLKNILKKLLFPKKINDMPMMVVSLKPFCDPRPYEMGD